ncbi:DNA cytosine methyltransferase [Streptomyces sp. NPDC001935]
MSARDNRWTVVDLFSGAGGMSWGFHAHPRFRIAAAVDAQKSKPSRSTLACNATYELNLNLTPLERDLQTISAESLRDEIYRQSKVRNPTILLACPPCTGFTRTLPQNHKEDDPRNNLVGRVAEFAEALKPKIIILENARELIRGSFRLHWQGLTSRLDEMGYAVHSKIYRLDAMGLPQRRERAIIIAVTKDLPIKTLDDLWEGLRVNPKAVTVRHAIYDLPEVAAGQTHPEDPSHVSSNATDAVMQRIEAIPTDGGSWISLFADPQTEHLATPAMRRSHAENRTNHFSDVYGRMAWDISAPVIKRECSHVGNGRYTHPEQNRLCTVREMAILQGFPASYRFEGASRQNAYRHVGDAVPPMISHQLAWVSSWILGGRRPAPRDFLLPGTSLRVQDIIEEPSPPEKQPASSK